MFLAVVPLLGHEFPVPAKDCVGGDDGCEFSQRLEAQRLAFDGQQTPLVVSEQDAILALALHEGDDLRVLKLDDLLLSAMDPAGQDGKQKLPRLQNRVHAVSGC
jgi:hypothetical protein